MDKYKSKNNIVLPLVFIVCGAGLAGFLIDGEVGSHGKWGEKTSTLMYLATILLIWLALSKVCSKYNRFKLWAMDTIIGCSSMAFLFGFILVGIVHVYMLLPFPTWLHFSVALFLALIGCCLIMFTTAGREGQ